MDTPMAPLLMRCLSYVKALVYHEVVLGVRIILRVIVRFKFKDFAPENSSGRLQRRSRSKLIDPIQHPAYYIFSLLPIPSPITTGSVARTLSNFFHGD